jgi:hypothetical protein
MSAEIIAALIGGGALVISSLVNGYVAKKVAESTKKLDSLEVRFDGRMDEMLTLARKESRAEGHVEGHAEGMKDQKEATESK